MKYIDADKLIAELRRQKHELELSIQSQGDYGQSSHIVAYENIISKITSLQQEQQEVDLEKEMNLWISENENIHHGDKLMVWLLKEVARYFVKWGAEHLHATTKMTDKSLDEAAENAMPKKPAYFADELTEDGPKSEPVYDVEQMSEWFKKAYEGKSLECDHEQRTEEWEYDNETDTQKAYREGQTAGRQEVFDHPGAYGLEKIDNVFGFRIGDKVRLVDGDGRPHIIKYFEKIEGLHGPDFYRAIFEDNTASDHIIPGVEYPNGYFTCMQKIDEQKEQKPAEWSEDFDEEVENVHKRYPEVSFAKLTRIAYHFSKWADRHKDTEWSEEDKKYLSQAIETLEHENYLILAEKLKSLRPQPMNTIKIDELEDFIDTELHKDEFIRRWPQYAFNVPEHKEGDEYSVGVAVGVGRVVNKLRNFIVNKKA